ncbi:Bro-N domain-containing protein [Streptomyces rimosus]|uniref:BRO-N domain-containing protein n=1 Tax=Streptomyces rimosus TaxID=1927 RepID=UPI000518FA0A
MSEYDTPACPESRQDAMDVSDFVYAATGARVRRITLPNGEHWFPAADICRELGYTTTRKALLDHVPEGRRELLETVTGSHSLGIPAGREWRRDLQMVDLQGLVLLVNGCTKPSCLPFKTWVSEVIVTIQREGSYSLRKAGTPVPGPGVPMAYAMPTEVADTIVRLEERNLRVDEEYADLRRQEMRLFGRIADSLERIADKLDAGAQPPGEQPTLTADELLADWKERQLVVT